MSLRKDIDIAPHDGPDRDASPRQLDTPSLAALADRSGTKDFDVANDRTPIVPAQLQGEAPALAIRQPVHDENASLLTVDDLLLRLGVAAKLANEQRRVPPELPPRPAGFANPPDALSDTATAPDIATAPAAATGPAANAASGETGETSKSRTRGTAITTMREAWRRSRGGIAIIFLLTAFINILKLTIPLYIFQLLDRVIASRSVDTLIMLTVIAGFAFAAATLAEMLRRVMLVGWGGWIKNQFGKALFASSFVGGKNRMPSKSLDDLNELNQFVSGSGITAWLDAIWAPAFLLLVYIIHPLLALIVLIGMILMLLLGIVNELVTRRLRSAARDARRKSDGLLAAAETNRETIAGLNVGPRLAARWDASASLQASENSANRLAGLSISEAMRYVEGVQRIACYAFGVWLTIEGAMTAGGVIAAAVLGRLGTAAVRKAMSSWRQLSVTWRAHQRITSRLKEISEPRSAIRDRNLPLSLNIDRVTHSYSSKKAAIIGELELTVAPGEALVLIGPSGTGKSTLARLIAGTLEPTSGRILLGELDVSRFTTEERQRLIGYLQQDTRMLPGTIADNISALREADPQDIVEAARMAGIHDVIMRLPKGYETQISDQALPLSGGEIRRIGLARAFFGQPSLIILDEPEANLDEALIAHMLETLSLCRANGACLVITSQSADFSGIADRIVVLDRSGQAQQYDSSQDFISDWYNRHYASKSAGESSRDPKAFASRIVE